MSDRDLHDSLCALDRPLGGESRELLLGTWRFRIDGLDAALAGTLQRRWGAFLGPPREGDADLTVRVFRSDERGWLPPPAPGERYRLEARGDAERPSAVAYHFAVCPDVGQGWRVALSREPAEPEERLIENALRWLVARRAVDCGGFCLHAAAFLHDGRAWVLAGPSGSGKTTAVGLCGPVLSLGDDLGVVIPGEGGWVAPAMPFDNAERIEHDPPPGWLPVAGIWRLKHSAETRIEKVPDALAVASLLGSAAFPWALPDRADSLLEHLRRFVADGGFAVLHFPVDADLRAGLLGAGPQR
jgi:hypothetical protein